jgi:hypothetical protein
MTNLIGKQFGELTVADKCGSDSWGHAKWNCKCSCGKEVIVTSRNLNGYKRHCGCKKSKGRDNHQWKGFGEISGRRWGEWQRGAKARNHDFEISIEEAWEQFLFQDKKCALSGIELIFNEGRDRSLHTASLDRIDSSKGYISGNIQWVHKDINIMKGNLDEKYFLFLVQKIFRYTK